jgi:hypothetical protein
MSHDYGICPHCHADGSHSSRGICSICGKSADIFGDTSVTPQLRRPRMLQKLWVLALKSDGFIPCAAEAHIDARPQLDFHPEGFIIPEAIASEVIINHIIMGMTLAMQVNSDAMPGDLFKVRIEDLDKFDVLFAEHSPRIVCVEVGKPLGLINGRQFHFPKMTAGMNVRISVTNISAKPLVFRGALLGTVPRSQEY